MSLVSHQADAVLMGSAARFAGVNTCWRFCILCLQDTRCPAYPNGQMIAKGARPPILLIALCLLLRALLVGTDVHTSVHLRAEPD